VSQTLVVLHLRAQGLGEGDEHPPTLFCGAGSTLPFSYQLLFIILCSLVSYRSFDSDNRFAHINDGPIKQNTIIELDPQSGHLVNQWGDNLYVSPSCVVCAILISYSIKMERQSRIRHCLSVCLSVCLSAFWHNHSDIVEATVTKKVKVMSIYIAPIHETSLRCSDIAHIVKGYHSFTCTPCVSSAGGMSHTYC